MLDNVFSSVRRGVERARVRGEEAYQTTRLRLEIFNLNREQDLLFGRLGRAYHGGADVGVLAQIQVEIRRVDDEIRSREALIAELSRPVPTVTGGMTVTPSGPNTLVVTPSHAPASTPLHATPTHAVPPTAAHVPVAPDVMGNRAASMSADPDRSAPDASTPGLSTDHGDPGEHAEPASAPDVQEKLQEGNERADPPYTVDRPAQVQEDRQRNPVHEAELREGQLSTEHPDPLDK